MIEMVLLGTGALSPVPERGLASAVLTAGGRSILFDCGEGTQVALRREHISPQKIDVIALSHYHGDHIFGLPGLLQTMFQEQRTAPLYILGPGEIRDVLAPVVSLAGYLTFDVLMGRAPKEGMRLDRFFRGWPDGSLLRAYPTCHRTPSQAYRFDLPRAARFLPEAAEALGVPKPLWGRLQRGEAVTLPDGRRVLSAEVTGTARQGLSAAVSGDTSPCPGLTEAARGTDLFVCEATYGDDADEAIALERGHSTYAMTARTAAAAGARRLWMTHFSHSMEDPEEYLPRAREVFPDAECGFDGKRLTLRFEE